MNDLKVGLIGCGKRGAAFADGYACSDDVTIVACADPDADNAQAIARRHDIPTVYTDYGEMLDKESPDIVGVCTWTRMHTQMILDAAESGVRAIHSEKPMAPTFGEAKRQHEVCTQRDVQLTFSHQRRFDPRFARAKQLIDEGAIGSLIRLEGCCRNMFDWGTHWFDMFFFYNSEQPAESVIGQLDPTDIHTWFDIPMEGAGISWTQFSNGVQGLMVTGHAGNLGVENMNRIIGSEGIIEVAEGGSQTVRFMAAGQKWQEADVSEVPFHEQRLGVIGKLEAMAVHDAEGPRRPPPANRAATALALLDAIECLKSGDEPMLGSRRALQATELIFATYESSRRRAKIVLPLDGEDSAFLTMLEDGTLTPQDR